LPEYYKDESTGKEYELKYYVVEISSDATTVNAYAVSGNTTTITNTEDTDNRETNDSITVNKKDEANKPLPGAVFTLYKLKDDGTTTTIKDYTTSDDGSVTIGTTDTALATYLPKTNGGSVTLKLKEKSAPDGYELIDTIWDVVISTAIEEVLENNKFVTVTTYTIKIDNGKSITVTNEHKKLMLR
jgi:hypothetical protein